MIRVAKSFGNIFVRSVKTSLFCFFPLLLSSVLFFVPFFLLDRFFWNEEMYYNRMVSILTLPGYTIIDVLVSAFIFVFFFLYVIALTNIIGAYDRKEKISFWKAYTVGFRKWPVYFFMQVAIIFHTIIRLFLIYPGVVYFARYSMAGFLLLNEDISRKEAMRRSQDMLKGNIHYFLDHLVIVSLFIYMISFPYFEFLERLYVQQRLSYNFSMSVFIDYAQTISMIWIFVYLYIYYYYLYVDISQNNRGEENESNH